MQTANALSQKSTEDRFTKPSDFCPHPHHWHSADDLSTEVEVSEMIAGLVRGLQPDLCIETGTCYGFTTYAIACALRRNGHGRIISYETNSQRAEYARRRYGYVQPTLMEIRSMRVQDDERLAGLKVDFAYIDSRRDGRVAEIFYLLQFAHRNTIFAIHDTKDQALISDALTRFTSIENITFPTPRGITLIKFLDLK